MSISTLSIRRHIGTLMLTCTAIVVGLFFITQLPVDLLPSITYPRISVTVQAPGISPEVAVDEITKPLEEAFAATEGVVQIYSTTREGRARVQLYFRPGGNIDRALNDATAAFNRSRSRLPEVIEEPRITKIDPSQLPVYEFALTSPSLAGVDLRVFAEEELARELTVVEGVAAVDISGGVEEEIRVEIDLQRLQALGVSLNDVLNELRDRNQDISGGRILGNNSEPLTRTVGRFADAEEIKNLSFTVNGDNQDGNSVDLLPPERVYLRYFAQVIDGTANQRVFVSLNQEPAIKVSINKQPDANTVEVVDAVKARLEALQQANIIPSQTLLIPTLDESIFIRNAITNVTTSGLIGAGLAAVAVILFLGSLRQTFIIILAIPLATLMAIILMGLFHLSLNIFSLGGLAFGVGIVVDNSIVMLETMAKGIQQEKQHRAINVNPLENKPSIVDIAVQSSRTVESALIASTATNLVAIVPFLLIGGFISLIFNELILTVSFAVAASIAIAVTVVPMLTSRMLAWRFSSGLGEFWFFRQFNLRFLGFTRLYGKLLAKLLKIRLPLLVVIFTICAVSSSWMLPQIPQEILPSINTGQARLFVSFPAGTPIETNRQVMEEVDKILRRQPETEYVFSTSGGFLFGTFTSANPLRSSATITLKPGSNIDAYVEKVSQEFQQLNLVDIRLRLFPGRVRGLILSNSPTRGADLDIILQGEDSKSLETAGKQVLAALDQNVTLARFRPDADEPQPEVQIRPNWERASELGLTASDIGETIQTAIAGSIPTRLQRGNRLIDVRVQLNQESIQNTSQLSSLPLFAQGNQPIRVSDVASLENTQAPGEIQRINQRQVYIIAGNLSEGASLSQATNQVQTALAAIQFPPGVSLVPSNTADTNNQLQNSLKILGGLAIFLVFVVMAVQYNSLVDPLVIMLTVPLAITGGILGLYITQTAIGATTIVGAVLLVGIVVNNAIMMIELANQIREQESITRLEAIQKAAPQRLRPVLMTTITTVLGMFPLALGVGEGSEFLQPMGVVVFSGLSLATLLTLGIIPCFYVLLHDIFASRLFKVFRS